MMGLSELLKGKPVADAIRSEVSQRIADWKAKHISPTLATILVGSDPASVYYAESKQKAAEKLGIEFQLHRFPESATESLVVDCVRELNADSTVHGIMVELPLPKHIDSRAVTDAVDPNKDIDGMTSANLFATMTGQPGLYPATPLACIRIAKHYGHTFSGKNVTLVGRGKTVGMPLIHLVLRENATVTICHSRTPDISSYLKVADIAFIATGKAGLIHREMVHPNLIVIDAGINETEDGQIVGDVDADVADVVAAMTPTPGGVGTVTTAQLFANLMHAMDLQMSEEVSR